MKKVYPVLIFLYCLLYHATVVAQMNMATNEKPAMAVGMRSNGKIYVVVAVVVTILLGVIAYLASLDRKISRLEKDTISPGAGH